MICKLLGSKEIKELEKLVSSFSHVYESDYVMGGQLNLRTFGTEGRDKLIWWGDVMSLGTDH